MLLLLGGGVLLLLSPPSRDAVRRLTGLEGFTVGARVSVAPLQPQTARLTVIVLSRASCAASRRAENSLRDLAVRARRLGDVNVALASTSHRLEDDTTWAARLGVPTTISGLSVASRVRLIPAVLVVDRSGRVRYYREGSWSDSEFKKVSQLITEVGR